MARAIKFRHVYAETIYGGRFCLPRGLAQVSNRTLFAHFKYRHCIPRVLPAASRRPRTLMSSTHSSDDIIIEKRFTTREHVRSLFADKCYVWQLRYLWDRGKAQYERELSTLPLSDNNRHCTCTSREIVIKMERERGSERGTYTSEMPRRKQCIPLCTSMKPAESR